MSSSKYIVCKYPYLAHLLPGHRIVYILWNWIYHIVIFISFSEGQIEDFVKKSKLLFSRHFVELRNREEVSAIASVKKLSDKRKGLNEVRALIRPDLEDIESGGPTFDAEIQAKEFVEKEFELMKKLCEVLFDQKRYPELQRITFSALGSPIFNKHTEIIKVKNLLETQ